MCFEGSFIEELDELGERTLVGSIEELKKGDTQALNKIFSAISTLVKDLSTSNEVALKQDMFVQLMMTFAYLLGESHNEFLGQDLAFPKRAG
jgi:hypothetical protein